MACYVERAWDNTALIDRLIDHLTPCMQALGTHTRMHVYNMHMPQSKCGGLPQFHLFGQTPSNVVKFMCSNLSLHKSSSECISHTLQLCCNKFLG